MSKQGSGSNNGVKPTGKRRKVSHVPGQLLGYSLQFTRMAALLLQADPGTAVSIEVFEDVGEETLTGKRRLSQTKSALTQNPIADHSRDLWKSIANWVDAIQIENVDPAKAYFEIYVSRPVTGLFANAFSSATNQNEAATALNNAILQLWGPSPGYPTRADVPDTIRPFVEKVFTAPRSVVEAIIQSFHLECSSKGPHADILTIIGDYQWVPQQRVATLAIHACGWVKQTADLLLEQQRPAIIWRDDFHDEMSRFTQSIVERHILQSFAPEPTISQRDELSSKIFVRQLEMIELDFEDICSAISDYFRAVYDCTLWGESGEVYPSSFVELDAALKRVWQNNRRSLFLQHNQREDIEKGQLLFFECQKHNQSIESMEPPSHFIPGCFHLLADTQEVGWHPTYTQLLADQKWLRDE